jgi:hypothetical protein
MGKLRGVELKRARLVPSAVFTSPEAVVQSDELSLAQKIEILRRWEFDARRTSELDPAIAMADAPGMLNQVRCALARLGVRPPNRSPDTRH